ncbi:MAG: hypothetical protein GY759_00815 [Chloroflexi bacterium]|nr:hypothetical protein [Chloroflexota bacterium]
MALATLGLASCELGDIFHARTCFSEALQLAAIHQDLASLMYALIGITLLLTELGLREQAIALHALASRYPMVANSCWFNQVIGSHITAVEVTMPSEDVSLAFARGRSRDSIDAVGKLKVELADTLRTGDSVIA